MGRAAVAVSVQAKDLADCQRAEVWVAFEAAVVAAVVNGVQLTLQLRFVHLCLKKKE